MTTVQRRPATSLGDADDCLDRAVEWLLARQHPDGWWRGVMETNVTMDAEDLLMRQFLGIRTDEQTQQSARWIRTKQRADGSFANFVDGPADPSTTAEAYIALRLAGDDPASPHMVAARRVVLDHGGLAGTRVFTRMWLALFGEYPWDEVPVVPPEMIMLPRWVPLNLYDFGAWARQTVAAVTVLSALRPVRPLGVDLTELHTGAAAAQPTPSGRPATALDLLDRALRAYQHHPVRPLRRSALARMVRWIVERQEGDGSWGGIQPPWVYSLMALHAYGYRLDDPVLSRGLAGWDPFTVHTRTAEGEARWVEACQSPVWDTALAVIALSDAGLAPDHPALQRAADWLVAREVHARGDWAVRRPHAAPSGWAFEFDNATYPDIDDAAEVVLALRRAAPTPSRRAAIERGVAWVCALQSRSGGWGAYDADNTRTLAYRLPFCDFGAVIDPPSADVTAHVVEMLTDRPGPARPVPGLGRGVSWLIGEQRPDGSWFGRWGANHVYGTGAALPALVAAGYPAGSSVVRRGAAWLVDHQADDGGWGEDLRSYTDPAWIGRGDPTPSQTAWALLGLHAAGRHGDPSAQAGVRWLVERQRADGGWDERHYTGTGFPGDFYLNYHLYRQVFPITALGRVLGRRTVAPGRQADPLRSWS